MVRKTKRFEVFTLGKKEVRFGAPGLFLFFVIPV